MSNMFLSTLLLIGLVTALVNQVAAEVRLVNGPVIGNGSVEGRVEILHNGDWGTVCDDSWSVSDAKVVCRQLGLPYGDPAALRYSAFGEGSGQIWMDDVVCYGNENSLAECQHDGWGVHNCQHDDDASVVCADGISEIRLVDGNNESEGRVEVLLGSVWGTVCQDYWSDNDAKVVCRQLGLPYLAAIAKGGSSFGHGTGLIWMDDVKCTGSETSLDQCPHRSWGIHNCGHHDDAGIICTDGDVATPPPPSTGSLPPQRSALTSTFTAVKNKQQCGFPGDVVVFERMESNIGDDFDPVMGNFTCRIAGTYYFTVHMMINTLDLVIQLMRNGKQIVSVFAYDGGDLDQGGSNSAFVELLVGDVVYLQFANFAGTVFSNNWECSTFSGILMNQ